MGGVGRSGPVSVLTFDTFRQRPEGEAKGPKSGEPYREARIGQGEVEPRTTGEERKR
jgi:hypothetical protein